MGEMGLLWGHYGDIRSLGGMWGCHRAIWGIKGDNRGDFWGIWGCCGVLGHYGDTEGDIRGILGGYLGDMGSLWGRYDIRSLGGMWGCHRATVGA